MYDVAVIGAGPAGISASIQLKRAGTEPLLLEKDKVGGLLLNANLVQNYPGFPDGISGEKLAEVFLRHLKNAGVVVRKETVKKIFKEKNVFRIVTEKDEIFVRCVILATGTLPKKLGIYGESSLGGRRLFYEIRYLQNDGKTFTVVGGGDIAFDYALNLSKTAEKIDMIIRGKKAKCIPVLAKEAKKRENIKIHYRTIPVSVKEEKDAVLECNTDEGHKNFVSDYVLVAVGRTPNIEMLGDELKEHIVPGLFFAGDVKNGDFKQVGISAGNGLMSAMKAVKFLREKT
jgi:thioredoxin reductase